MTCHSSQDTATKQSLTKCNERGAALATALFMLALLSAIAMTVLAVVSHEGQIAGSDLQRTQACYASAAGIERMTNDFSDLFAHTSRPSDAQLQTIANTYPTELISEGYTFPEHTIALNQTVLDEIGSNATVQIPNGPFGGLYANLKPYTLTTTAHSQTAECKLTRDMNNYLIPLFQFGMFSDEDIELHPGPAFSFNGRIHANGNIYVNGNVKLLAKVTTANEFIYDVLRNNSSRTGATVSMQVGSINVAVTKGSMTNGPNIVGSTAGQRGYFPGSPNGTINTSWNTTSVAPAQTGVANKFGGQLLTRTTGAAPLKLPLQLDGNPTREIIKRDMPNDTQTLSESRYHAKAEIRILIDDENPSTTDASGIPAGQGVTLSTFNPIPLPNAAPASGGGRALWRVPDSGGTTYSDTTTSCVLQKQNGAPQQADTVRGVKAGTPVRAITGASGNPITITSNGHGFNNGDTVVISGVQGNTNANGSYTVANATANTFQLSGRNSGPSGYTANTGTAYSYTAITKSPNGVAIPSGAGITGRILIQIVDASGVARDVTTEVLSMGMTEGEPNAIVMLQRPLWASFTQGSRDASGAGATNYLSYILNSTYLAADGEIRTSTGPTQDATYGYLTGIVDDDAAQPQREDMAPPNSLATLLSDWGTGSTPSATWTTNRDWNAIVPINVYNMREGHLTTSMNQDAVYERGITNVIEVNMRNLARWMDGTYDQNLLANTNAVSANIAKPDGYIVYVSDRRGDRVRSMVDLSGATINSSNGMADNEDIYGPNGQLDPGEDVQNKGALVKDTNELPDPAVLSGACSSSNGSCSTNARIKRALSVAAWSNPSNYYRRSVRLFNGENLQVMGTSGKLSTTLGITMSSENMMYVWGNYNTTGINQAPASGTATLNDPAATSHYNGNQVPASIVCDAVFPLSKTWFDSEAAMYPDNYTSRPADNGLPGVTSETSVRAAVIAGNNLSALTGSPDAANGADSRLCGGMHNFPRFLEDWLSSGRRWNIVGSFVPLYHSTQALGQWWYITGSSAVYGAPVRNWAFDTTFLQGDRLPPGTPMFQYIEPTAFRQVL